eukprot:m.68886 g.68886  ORF g.68886 m.68886 type:complete len:561 (-) comp13705_c0_seq1:186-1868(-)
MLVPRQPPSDMDQYVRVKLLGKGTFGKAWKVRNSVDNNEYVAKQIKCESKQDLQDALSEAEVLSKLNHTHIVSYYKVIQNSPKMVTIIMEYCAGGDIGEKISRRKFRNQYFEESTIQLWIVQAAEALSYLHNRGILHRDVKPANLFLTSDSVVKLGDFGIARIMDRNAIMPCERTTKTPVGTPMYFSPEMCSGKRYGQKADIWALGCVLYEMAALRPAFTAFNIDSLTAKIKRGHHDKHLPVRYGQGLRKLIAQMLIVDANLRPTADQVLQSDYLALAVVENGHIMATSGKHAPVEDPLESVKQTPDILILDEEPDVSRILTRDMPQRKLAPLSPSKSPPREQKPVLSETPPAHRVFHYQPQLPHAHQPHNEHRHRHSPLGPNGGLVDGRGLVVEGTSSSRGTRHEGQDSDYAHTDDTASDDPSPSGKSSPHIYSRHSSPLIRAQQLQADQQLQRPYHIPHDRRQSQPQVQRYGRFSPKASPSPSHLLSPVLQQASELRRKSEWDVRYPSSQTPEVGGRRHSVDVPRSRSKSPVMRYQLNPRQNFIAPSGGRYNISRGLS